MMMRQMNWWGMLPQLVLMLGLMFSLEYGLRLEGGALFGAMLYLGIVFLVQWLIPHHHRRGLALIRQSQYTEAIQAFQASYQFFSERLWLDRYRAIFIFSISRMSYREMALLNVAYCHLQLKAADKAKAQYEEILRLFPDSQYAQDALAYLTSDEQPEQVNE